MRKTLTFLTFTAAFILSFGCATNGQPSKIADTRRAELVIQRAGIAARVELPHGWKAETLDPATRPFDADLCARLRYGGDADTEIFIRCGFPYPVKMLGIAAWYAEELGKNLPESSTNKSGVRSFSHGEPAIDADDPNIASFTFEVEQVKPVNLEKYASVRKGAAPSGPEEMYEIVSGKVSVRIAARSLNHVYIFQGEWARAQDARFVRDFDAIVRSLTPHSGP